MTALWGFPHTEKLLPGPRQHGATSVAFAIQQQGSNGQKKVRRGEDWRRGLRNCKVSAKDSPVNHRAESFVAVARHLARQGKVPVVWGADQQAAYRQLPVSAPEHTWVVLFTGAGPALWRRRCLMFGAVGPVWAYARTADCMVYLNRALNFAPTSTTWCRAASNQTTCGKHWRASSNRANSNLHKAAARSRA